MVCRGVPGITALLPSAGKPWAGASTQTRGAGGERGGLHSPSVHVTPSMP